MNITRENLNELDLLIKVEIAESDYAERVSKQLKEYQKKATVPGFRKGMAPMGLIQRMYKSAIVADEVQSLLGESLYKYLDDEKLARQRRMGDTRRIDVHEVGLSRKGFFMYDFKHDGDVF